MDDGEIELSDHDVLLQNSESSSNAQASVDSILDELLKTAQTCTHTHTCNPPGPDVAHTHTCYHTHTQVFPAGEQHYLVDGGSKNPGLKPKRPSGNREAVRKYREKKKAHTAYLEEEVKKLRVVNQQLIRKLQRQAVLETEILRLRGVLVDLRGKIDSELGAFPFQKHCNSTADIIEEGDRSIRGAGNSQSSCCQADLPCFHPSSGIAKEGCRDETAALFSGHCKPPVIGCQVKARDAVETLVPSVCSFSVVTAFADRINGVCTISKLE